MDITEYESDRILEDNLFIWRAARDKHNRLAIKLTEKQKDICETLAGVGIDYFFDTLVDNVDTLVALKDFKVSDIYICNDFAFSLKDIATVCHKNNINVRVYPNIAQGSCERFKTNSFKKFFIRPEDIFNYEAYVDICEFYTDNITKQDVLLDIYRDKKWLGSLGDLILNLDEEYSNIANPSILPDFGKFRVNCNKKCAYNKCEICDRVLIFTQIADKIKEESGKEIVIRREENDKSTKTEILNGSDGKES